MLTWVREDLTRGKAKVRMRTLQGFQEGKRQQVKLGEGKMAEALPRDPEALTLHFLLLFGFCLT